MVQKLFNSPFVKKLEQFFMSRYFIALSFGLACVATVTRREDLGLIVFAALILVALLFCRDIIATTFPFLVLTMLMIKCHGSYDRYIKLVWLAVPAVLIIVFHFVNFRKPLKVGRSFWALAAVAVAVTLGGVGSLSAKDYFALVSVYHVAGLGFGLVLAYLLMNSHFDGRAGYSLEEKFSNIMHLVGLFGCFMVLSHYAFEYKDVIASRGIIYFQWRNNISTFLMLAMPFSFYASIKKPACLWAGIIEYLCVLLSGSRGGLIFGSVEMLPCVAFIIYADKNKRKRNILLFSALASVAVVFSGFLVDFFGSTIERIMDSKDDVRVELYKRAVADFKSNPVFGRGLGYFGNNDLWRPAKFSLNWYNSAPFQIIGSTGLVGVAAYAYQFYIRNKILWTRVTPFKLALGVSYIGIVMMSLVNPGEFVPLPYELLVVLFFIIAEKCSDTDSRRKAV